MWCKVAVLGNSNLVLIATVVMSNIYNKRIFEIIILYGMLSDKYKSVTSRFIIMI